ncbi:unnamed protein product [Heligmosomoides polygyrus]|uniref:Ras-GAP domain-containing protein n=1 Tax=Heligmosomoides polygyrus TaxID=6339 RepID=A0A183FS72_HELPZ|nr:unnamed protein product [Heligmosomoides polygyrus]
MLRTLWQETSPHPNVIVRFLNVMMKHSHIGEFEIVDDHRAGKIVVNVNDRLNKCSVIFPRFDIMLKDIEQYTTNLLPSRQFRYLIQITSGGSRGSQEETSRRKSSWIFWPFKDIIVTIFILCIHLFYLFFLVLSLCLDPHTSQQQG